MIKSTSALKAEEYQIGNPCRKVGVSGKKVGKIAGDIFADPTFSVKAENQHTPNPQE